MSKIKKFFTKGSILAYTLIILSVMLVIATSFSSASLMEQKSASTTAKTTQAFQVAESGLEWALANVKSQLKSFDNPTIFYLGDCEDGKGNIVGNIGDPKRHYEIQFYEANGSKVIDCDFLLEDVAEIKSIGTFGDTVRSVQMGLNSGPCVLDPFVSYLGHDYKTVAIGDQCWFRENLNIGTKILGSSEPSDDSAVEKWCYGDNDTNCETHGGLYSWAEANGLKATCNSTDVNCGVSFPYKGICPAGWHVPTDLEWHTLESFYATGACSPSRNAFECDPAGTNLRLVASDKFSALMGGFRDTTAAHYYGFGSSGWGKFWSSTKGGTSQNAVSYGLYETVLPTKVARGTDSRIGGLSVRCIKD